MHKPTQEELDIYNAKILATLVSTSYPIYPTFIDMSGTTIGELYVDKYAGRNRHKNRISGVHVVVEIKLLCLEDLYEVNHTVHVGVIIEKLLVFVIKILLLMEIVIKIVSIITYI